MLCCPRGLACAQWKKKSFLKLVLIMVIRNSLMFFVIAQRPGRQASGGGGAAMPCTERETARQPRTVRHGGENSGWQEPTLAGLAIIIAEGETHGNKSGGEETARQPRTVRHRGESSGWQEPTLAGLAIIIAG